MESKKAIFPRILISEDLVNYFNADKNGGTIECFLKDADELYYLNYLPVALHRSESIQVYKKITEEKIDQLTKRSNFSDSDKEILKKWVWFKDYIFRVLNKQNGCLNLI